MGIKIDNFKDIRERHELSADALKAINERLARSMGISPDETEYTGLQRMALFDTKGFWLSEHEENRHIVVQGATSAGKTLISEMAILDSLKHENDPENKCIVLVPLKAMVRERCNQLRKDLEAQGTTGIYASSSDYLDHDGEIVEGDYTIAVIVYEKFFAMLLQSNGKMLKKCRLLVVDELQMLNKHDRGPKLEVAIQKVLRRNALGGNETLTRIMCLTTCDCNASFIEKWLTIDSNSPIVIRNEMRPTSLLEHVILTDGSYRASASRGEDNIKEFSPYGKSEKLNDEGGRLEYRGEISVPDYVELRGGRSDEPKRRLLKALLREIYARNRKAKVLVFVNGRERTRYLADYIANQIADDKILPRLEMSERLSRIENYDVDKYQKLLRNRLFPRRIACHNAAMSTALRELIEELFDGAEDSLRLVVATETLTVGMNMPVDVMIIFDNEVPRKKGDTTQHAQPLTGQEYKNYVGRAGRLGQQNMKSGMSFIIATKDDEAHRFWNGYVNSLKEDIVSSLKDEPEIGQAPYYLSLLSECGDDYTSETVQSFWEESFSCKCGGRAIDAQKMCDVLMKAKLCRPKSSDDDDELEHYELTPFGRGLAAYAFGIKTCNKIRRYFFNGGYKEKQTALEDGQGGLPFDTTNDELSLKGYLLDMLYILCQTPEVIGFPQVSIPNGLEESRKASAAVLKALKKMHQAGHCKFWKDSTLELAVNDDCDWIYESRYINPLMRAIILWHWTRGDLIEKIEEETEFKLPLVVGDIARLAEIVAYQLEAISRTEYRERGRNTTNLLILLPRLYRLSTQVNYGVPRNLVRIANKNVPKLERKAIFDLYNLCREYPERYDDDVAAMLRDLWKNDPARILKIISGEICEELLRRIDESSEHNDIKNLFEAIKRDLTNLSDEVEDALKNLLADQSARDDKCVLPSLSKIFLNELESEERDHIFGDNIKLDFPIADKNFAMLECNDKTFFLIALNDKASGKIGAEYENQFKRASKRAGKFKVILLTAELDEKLNEVRQDYEALDGLKNNLSAMTYETFVWLLAHSIKITDFKGKMLMALLWDINGVFRPNLKNLNQLLQNYEHNSEEIEGDKRVRLLCDKRNWAALNDLRKVLKEVGIEYRELSWGEALGAEREQRPDEPTLLFLSRSTVRSFSSLDKFCYGLGKDGYRRTYGICRSREEFEEWGAPFAHCETTRNFAEDIGIGFRLLLRKWRDQKYLIGVSYAHERQFDNEREGVRLLKKFVAGLEEKYKDLVLFDQSDCASHEFNGDGAQPWTLEKYKECAFFILLDDEYYDCADSVNCKKELAAIIERLSTLKGRRRLWLLNPPNTDHCKYHEKYRANDGYSTSLSEGGLNKTLKDFLKRVEEG